MHIDGSAGHVLELDLALVSAIYVYLLKHVTSPPPHLFLANPGAYARQVANAGASVLLEFLEHVGAPVLRWQYGGRAGDGTELPALHAQALHLYRSVSHKVSSARISLYTLMGLCCAHPKLRELLRVTASISPLGREGGNVYADRYVEFIQNLMKRRNSCHAAFESALQFTPHLPALMHAHAAYEAAVLGAPTVEDPVRASTHVEVDTLVAEFIRLLGADLTVPVAENPFWHTGTPTDRDSGDYKARRPGEWAEKVAQGRAYGKDSAQLESVQAWAERLVGDAW